MKRWGARVGRVAALTGMAAEHRGWVMSLTRRREILEAHELLHAPAACQQVFWARYNFRGGRVRAKALGELAGQLASSPLLKPYDGWGELMRAWREVVPPGCAESARPQSLAKGRLRVAVGDSVTMYALARRHGESLVAALNERLGRSEIKRLDLRLSASGRGKRAEAGLAELKRTGTQETSGKKAESKTARKDRA